jgi:hypothetical protein
MNFLIALFVERRYSAVFAFDNDADASKAASLIKKAATRSKK